MTPKKDANVSHGAGADGKLPSLVDLQRMYAESAGRVFATTAAEQLAQVRLGKRTMPRAIDIARRKLTSLRAEYFARERDGTATEKDWTAHGPDQAFQKLITDLRALTSPEEEP